MQPGVGRTQSASLGSYTDLAELYFEQRRYKESLEAGQNAFESCSHPDYKEYLMLAVALVEQEVDRRK